MKKLLFLLVMLVVLAVEANAQSTQVATLSHEGTVTSYTSANALRDAYNAAVDGDVITLSSGSFVSVNFEKRITVRGAGMGVKIKDTDPYVEPTLISGSFTIDADGDENHSFKLEGILCENQITLSKVSNSVFTKCKIKNIINSSNYTLKNLTFVNCIIYENLKIAIGTTANLYGCYLYHPYSTSGSVQGNPTLITLTNCIICDNSTVGLYDYYTVANNCIYINKNSNTIAPTTTHGNIFNSLWYGYKPSTNSTFSTSLTTHNNTIVPEVEEIFKEGTFYQLTDEAKKYLGGDGSEVGLYGSSLPFDPTPTNPQIVKFNVAPKTTADGKLSVDIEVNSK